jgi:hypothetical protein
MIKNEKRRRQKRNYWNREKPKYVKSQKPREKCIMEEEWWTTYYMSLIRLNKMGSKTGPLGLTIWKALVTLARQVLVG